MKVYHFNEETKYGVYSFGIYWKENFQGLLGDKEREFRRYARYVYLNGYLDAILKKKAEMLKCVKEDTNDYSVTFL